jgi:hypothetical protein
MRPLPLLLLLAATASVAATEVPPPFRGDYVSSAFADAVLQRAPTIPPSDPIGFTVGASSLTRASHVEADELKVTSVQEKNGRLTLRLEAQGDQKAEVFTLSRENGLAVLSDGKERWVRLTDALPAADFLPSEVLRTFAYLSRGWWKDGRPWHFVPRLPKGPLKFEGDPQGTVQQGPSSTSFQGGFVFSEVLGLGKELFLFEPKEDGTLHLLPTKEPADGEGPDYEPLPGRKPTVLQPMSEPPFLVLADKLTLRTRPSADAPKVALLDNLTPVALWARREGTDTLRSSLRGTWLLVQAGDKVGWAFSPYLGLRQEPSPTARPGPTRVGPATDSGPTYVFGLEAQKPVCQVRAKQPASPKAAPTEAERVALVLARLNDDATLDPVCLYTRTGYLTLCPLLSHPGGTAFTPAGCLDVPAEVLPPLWAKDSNGDGHLDLHLGEGQDVQVALYDAALKAFAWQPATPP